MAINPGALAALGEPLDPTEDESVPTPSPIPLEQMRKRHMLTRFALARAAGVADTTVADIERGSVPRYRTILKISNALGCRPEDIAWPGDPLGLGTTP